MFKFFKTTAPVLLVVGVVLLTTEGSQLWKTILGALLLSWGLAFVQVKDG